METNDPCQLSDVFYCFFEYGYYLLCVSNKDKYLSIFMQYKQIGNIYSFNVLDI